MKTNRTLRAAAIFLLLVFALLLYADLESIHQIHPITESRINRATDEETRQYLVDARDKRNKEKRSEKLRVELALSIDFLLIAYFSWTLVKNPATERA